MTLIFSLSIFIIYLPRDTQAQSGLTPIGRAKWYGYFNNKEQRSGLDVVPKEQVGPDLINPIVIRGSGTDIQKADDFINIINIWANLSDIDGVNDRLDTQKRTAAQFIVSTMLGKTLSNDIPLNNLNRLSAYGQDFENWKKIIYYYAQNGLIEFDFQYSIGRKGWNSYYQPSYNDVAMYWDKKIDSGSSIVFKDPNNRSRTLYEIRKECANPLGDLRPLTPPIVSDNIPSLVIDRSDYEKGSGNRIIKYTMKGNNKILYCSGLFPQYDLRVEKTVYGNKFTETVKLQSCKAEGDVYLGTAELPTNIDDKPIGNSEPLSLRVTFPDGRSFDSQKVFSIFEAPWVLFNGNDVRSCPADINNSRFLFKPNFGNHGSRNWLASLWKTEGATFTNNSSAGWSTGLNTYNNASDPTLSTLNALKTTGIECDTFDSSGLITGSTEEISEASFSGLNEKVADKILIKNSIEPNLTPTSFTTNPPIYKIRANDVFIHKDVQYIRGVLIEAKNIYTCSDSYNIVKQSEWHLTCNKPLRIDGSLNAQNLYLMRVTGSRYLTPDGGGSQADSNKGRPAEVITYPAYFFFTNIGGAVSSGGQIQSYSQAPPRL